MFHRNPRHPFVLSTLPLALAAAIAPAAAQDPIDSPRRASALEEVIVTAQKREESLQDAPIAISAFSSADIENMGVEQVTDVTHFTPNMSLHRQSASNATVNFSIRGITEPEPSMSVDPAVGVYMDGIYMARNNGLAFDVVDLERIEVLRGPQGTLYGRNSTGGAINIVTAKPSGEFEFQQSVSVGNYDRLKAHTIVDLPTVAGVSAKLSYLYNTQGGWVDNETTNFQQGRADDFGEQDNDAYHIALNWAASDTFTVDYSFDKTDGTGTPAAFQLTRAEAVPASVFGANFDPNLSFGPGANDGGIADSVLLGTYAAFGNAPVSSQCSTDPSCTAFANTANPAFGGATPAQAQLGTFLGVYGNAAAAADEDRKDALNLPYAGREQMDIEGHSVTATWDITDTLTVKSLTGYREMDLNHRTGLSGGGFLDLTAVGGGVVTLFAAGAPNRKSHEQFSQEFQFLGDVGQFQYLAGLYYFNEEAEEVTREQTAFLFGDFGTQRSYQTDNSAWAAFGQLTYTPAAFDDRLDITLGLRYTEDEREITIDEVVNGLPASGTFDTTFDNTSGSLTFDYAFDMDVTGYFRVATGYKAGGFLSRTSIANQQPFDAETLTSYEIGLKSQWLENRLRLNGAIFYSEYDDKQVTQFVPTTTGAESTVQNAAAASYQGLELELIAIPLEGLTLNFNYGYLDPEYDEYSFFDPTGQFCGAPGTTCDVSDRGVFANAPENTASAGIQYDFHAFSFGQLSARVDVAYSDGYTYGTIENRFDEFVRNDAFTLVNARMILSDIDLGDAGNLTATLWGKNLTDEFYRQSGIGAFESVGFAGVVYNPPRMYGFDLDYRF
ncbi:TonB-dependent receptor [Parahaliea mediterranea]|uniref:TonB-dependent receptor n=1 Tax=Parahaliea mediterranea TaxID=651086 RepID=A0A939DE90_9GAMM|nr:TonB-dependent receptor [Parahaliea mediterranea]MBN7796504.1 TonB-dependent receptor [Parahaliea mediterranea]